MAYQLGCSQDVEEVASKPRWCRHGLKTATKSSVTEQTRSCYWFPNAWAAFGNQFTSKRKIAHTCQRDLHGGIYWNPLKWLHSLCALLVSKKQRNALPGCLLLWTTLSPPHYKNTTTTRVGSFTSEKDNWPAVASVKSLLLEDSTEQHNWEHTGVRKGLAAWELGQETVKSYFVFCHCYP